MSYDCSAWPADLGAATDVTCVAEPALTGADLGAVQTDLFSVSKTKIDVASNGLVGSITSWSAATALQELSLKDNALTGSLPAEAPGFLSTLTTLDLSDNDFSGTIPSYFAQFTALQTLDISGNAFDGCVPCPPLIDCTLNDGLAGLQGNGDPINFCKDPTDGPTVSPSTAPSFSPSTAPSFSPSLAPSLTPSLSPEVAVETDSPVPITNSPATELPITSSPTVENQTLNSAGHGSETFGSSFEFALVSSALLGTLGFLLVYCTLSAVFLRRQRFLRRVIDGKHSPIVHHHNEPDAPISARGRPRDGIQRQGNSREGSSANQGTASGRHNALSFDGREGWRSDAELRNSVMSLHRSGSLMQNRG